MTFAIAPTDLDWFAMLKGNSPGREINFWTPTPWNITRLQRGEPWYFMLKSPIRCIGGHGQFSRYEDLPVSEAWRRYGIANGVRDADALFVRTRKYAARRAQIGAAPADPVIGCVILSDPVFLDEADYFDPADYGFPFAREIVKQKYYDEPGIPYQASALAQGGEFRLIDPSDGDRREVAAKDRVGQAAFRQRILRAYDNRCAATRTQVTEVLEAAHIQPYINASSNHVQNGLCLRADLHHLFDAGLIAVDRHHRIMVAERLASASRGYRTLLTGRTLELPVRASDRPSEEAMAYHRVKVFIDQSR